MPDFKWLINITGRVDGKLKTAAREAEQSISHINREITTLEREAQRAEKQLESMASGADLQKAADDVRRLENRIEQMSEAAERAEDLLEANANKRAEDVAKVERNIIKLTGAIAGLSEKEQRALQIAANANQQELADKERILAKIGELNTKLEELGVKAATAADKGRNALNNEAEEVERLNKLLTEQTSRREELANEIGELSREHARLKQISDGQVQITEEEAEKWQLLKNRIQETKDELEELVDERKGFAKQAGQQQRIIDNIEKQKQALQELQAQYQQMQDFVPGTSKEDAERLVNVRRQISSYKDQIRRTEDAQIEARVEADKLNKQLEELGVTAETLDDEFNGAVGQARKKMNEFAESVANGDEQIDKMTESISALSDEQKILVQREKDSEKQYDKNQRELKKLTTQINSAQSRLNDMQDKAEGAQRGVEALARTDQRIEQLNEKLEKNNAIYEKHRVKFEGLGPKEQRHYEQLTRKLERLNKQLEQVDSQTDKTIQQMDQLPEKTQQSLKKAGDEAERYRREIDKVQNEIKQLEQEHEDLPAKTRANFQKAQNDARSYRQEIERIEGDLQRANQRLTEIPDKADKAYGRTQQRAQRMRREVEEANRRLEEARRKLEAIEHAGPEAMNDLRTSADRARARVAALNRQLDESERQSRQVGSLSNRFGQLAVAMLGAVSAGVALNQIFAQTSQYVRMLNDARFRGGFSDTQYLQRAMFAFSRFGIQQEQIKTMIEDSSRSIRESLAEPEKIIPRLDPRVQLNPMDMLMRPAAQQLHMFLEEYARLADEYSQEVAENLARAFMLEEGAEFLAGFAANKNLDDVLEKMDEVHTISNETILALTVMEGAFNNLKLSLIGVASELIGAAAPALTALLDKIIPVVQSFAKWLEQNPKMAKFLGLTLITALAAATVAFTLLGSAIAVMAAKAIFAGGALAGILGVVSAFATPILAAIAAIGVFVFALVKVWQNLDRIKAVLQTVANLVRSIFGWRGDAMDPIRDVAARRRQVAIDEANRVRASALIGQGQTNDNRDQRQYVINNTFDIKSHDPRGVADEVVGAFTTDRNYQ